MEKFGQVYIKNNIGDYPDDLELVPLARFSNLDHKWYDSDGSIHSEYYKHVGMKFSLMFESNQLDKNGHLVHFQGKIYVPYTLGYISDQDFEGLDEAEKEDLETVRQYNLISFGSNEERTYIQLQQAAFLAACYPGCKLSDTKIQRLFNLAFFAFDDHMEEYFTGLKFGQLEEFLKASYNIMYKCNGNIRFDHETFPTLSESLLNYLKYIQFFERKLSIAENGTERGKYIREAIMEYLHSVFVETCQEWNKNWSEYFEKAQTELRIVASAANVCLELGLFDANIEVKAEIRNTFLFKWFVRLYAQHASWSNDVVSYGKEIKVGRAACNTVYLLHYYGGMSLRDAMQKVLDRVHRCSVLLVETGRMLAELYQDDENVQRFVNKAKDIAYGNVQWCAMTDRYHEGFCYDCIVEENEI